MTHKIIEGSRFAGNIKQMCFFSHQRARIEDDRVIMLMLATMKFVASTPHYEHTL